MDVELRHLRYFVAVAEELHFGRAAARLHMAQPPLSQQIRKLEEAVGCPLLQRTSRSVRLTPARARVGRRGSTGETGLLNVGFVGSAMLTTLPGILRRHLDVFPGVQLQLHESYTSRVLAGLGDGGLDAGIVRDAEPVDGLTLATPEVACLPLDEARVVSDVELVRREDDDRPMLAAFGRIATGERLLSAS